MCIATNIHGNTEKVAEVIVESKKNLLNVWFLFVTFEIVGQPTAHKLSNQRLKEKIEDDTVSLRCTDERLFYDIRETYKKILFLIENFKFNQSIVWMGKRRQRFTAFCWNQR